MSSINKKKIPVRKIFLVLSGVVFLLLFLHHRVPINGNVFNREISRLFDLDGEGNIPAWFSGSLLLTIAYISLLNSWFSRQLGETKVAKRFWMSLFFIFLFFSFDEVGGIHESITYITNIKWVYLYAPFAFILIFLTLTFFFTGSGNKEVLSIIIVGILIFIAGGLVAEWVYYQFGAPDWLDRFKIRFEEGLEMFGVIIILAGCLQSLNHYLKQDEDKADEASLPL